MTDVLDVGVIVVETAAELAAYGGDKASGENTTCRSYC